MTNHLKLVSVMCVCVCVYGGVVLYGVETAVMPVKTVCLLRLGKIIPSNKVQEYNQHYNSMLIFLLKDVGRI